MTNLVILMQQQLLKKVCSMEPKVFPRRFFDKIHSKYSTTSRVEPKASLEIKIIMKNQPKISENPCFRNDRVLEGNTCGKVQNFYKNAIFVIFLNWCKVWNLYHDPFREETSVGNCFMEQMYSVHCTHSESTLQNRTIWL